MLENFHATIKMITGEEVLAEVLSAEENNEQFFVLSNPIVIQENVQIDQEKGIAVSGMIPKKWMNFANDEMTVVNKTHVVSMSELDKFGIEFYEKALIAARVASPIKKRVNSKDNTGFLGKIDGFRDKLKGIFDASPDLPSN